MAITEMSLPVDIPWKRMGVSKDMIDQKKGDLKFPHKWRSSIAVFYHEPTEAVPDYCHRKITYLKVVCTITNYQVDKEDPDENITVLDEIAPEFEEFYAWKDFVGNVTRSFPCYGALLQVAVFPNPAEGVALHDIPYISAFQPRKRETYEVLTQSGEVASQSGNKLNVLKGTTNTDTTEEYDLYLGGAAGGGSIGWGLISGEGKEANVEEGTVNKSGTENQNITSKDASREKRESHAYSTSINQLYTLLQGYHLGSNRALFFMQPRPHMQDQKFTFIRGLRRLEGIQEFFLIVDRDAKVPGICVEVALETAHIYLERAYRARIIAASDLYISGNLNKTPEALGLDIGTDFSTGPEENHWDELRMVENWNAADPYLRFWAADPEKPHPSQLIEKEAWTDLQNVAATVPGIGAEEVALIFEEYESDTGDFFVTGRRLCTCLKPVSSDQDGPEGVDCEQSEEMHISTCDTKPTVSITTTSPYGGVRNKRSKPYIDQMKAGDLNAMVNDLNDALQSSLGSTNRFAYGEVSFFETEFILDELAQLVRLLKKAGGIQDRVITDVASMHPFVERGLGRTSIVRNVLDLGTVTTTLIARDLKVSAAEARKIRRDLLLAALKALDATTIRTDLPRVNPILERLRVKFPRLRELVLSARGVAGRPALPKKPKQDSPRPNKGKQP